MGDALAKLVADMVIRVAAISFLLGVGCTKGCEHFPWRLKIERIEARRG